MHILLRGVDAVGHVWEKNRGKVSSFFFFLAWPTPRR